jgi:hypothetical protein
MTASREQSEPKQQNDKSLVRALEHRLGKPYQQFVFWRAMRRYLRAVADSREADDSQLLNEQVRGWGNSG